MGFLDHIRACNRHDPSRYIPFAVNGVGVGRVLPSFAGALDRWPGIFRIDSNRLVAQLPQESFTERSEIFADVLAELDREDLITHLHGEQYVATPGGMDDGLLLIDRAAAPFFGTRAFGQHINGFVRARDGLKMWIGKRASDRRHFPGHLDNLAAGGLPYGIALAENIVKECWEEAGIPREMAMQAISVGALTYNADTNHGFKPDTLFCYDLELPEDFEPRCTDGEVEEFYLLPVEEVLELVRDTDRFKLNCNLVVMDFLIRHGYLGPDEPDYLALVEGLHPSLQPL
ncbi:MAG: DUF4743 domain-containing protein [Candidatus Sedimenticola sp. 6PFRAG5]